MTTRLASRREHPKQPVTAAPPDRNRYLVGMTTVATLLGIAHHTDHVIRGNHVGWPISQDINPFTFSLAFYPVVLLGLYLHARNRAGAGFWAILTGVGAAVVGVIHLGPWAVEPPHDIRSVYQSPIAGWAAFGLLLLFLTALASTSLYGLYLYVRNLSRERHPAESPHEEGHATQRRMQ